MLTPLLLLLPALPMTQDTTGSLDDVVVMAKASNEFGLNLYGELAGVEGNLCLSPTSVYAALMMTSFGAAGATADEMFHTLRLPLAEGRDAWTVKRARAAYTALLMGTHLDPNEHSELVVVSALWGDESFPFRAQTVDELQHFFGASLRRVDFARAPEEARGFINHWAAKATHERIEDLIPEGTLDAATRLVLANAVYFKNTWAEPFSESATSDARFHVADGQTVSVPTLRKTHRWLYTEDDDAQVLQLAYTHGPWAMTLVLPKERGGLSALEAKLDERRFSAWIDALESQRVALELPKFEFEDEHTLNRALAALGMPTAFTQRADFSRFAGDGGQALMIDDVLQKTFIAVDESGTEAAAATAIRMRLTAEIPSGEPVAFKADHPFLFLIRDTRTGHVLFLGRVADPR